MNLEKIQKDCMEFGWGLIHHLWDEWGSAGGVWTHDLSLCNPIIYNIMTVKTSSKIS